MNFSSFPKQTELFFIPWHSFPRYRKLSEKLFRYDSVLIQKCSLSLSLLQMSFPNRSTYEEAICDLKRKLQQQQQDNQHNTSSSTGASSVNSVIGGTNNNYSNSLRQSTSTISDIADSTTMPGTNKNPVTETITLAPNGPEYPGSLLNNANTSARPTKDDKNDHTFPVLTTFKNKVSKKTQYSTFVAKT